MDKRSFLKTIFTGSMGYALSHKAYPFVPHQENLINADHNLCDKTGTFPFTHYLRQYDVGDYIPKDQGGKFIQMEILNTEEDALIVEKIQNGILQQVYGDPIDWVRFEKLELEKSVWLARLYFIPSFARIYYLTKEKHYLDYALSFTRLWYRENSQLAQDGKTRYNWTDMQIAWRCIHLSWLYFLGEDQLSRNDKEFIADILQNHSSVLLEHFGEQKLNEFNHQAHGALAMLYVGALFPGMPHAGELLSTAQRILEHHIRHAFYPDGGNVEQMFGYYPFEAHIFRDAYLLCTANNIALPAGIESLLYKMREYLLMVKQPDDTMPVVNDSYEMPVTPIVATLSTLLSQPISQKNRSKLFAETQIGIVRDDADWYLLANPAKSIGAHMHAGRLAFNFWYKGSPLLRDSGCCNYDDPLLVSWYRTTKAHNTVIIDGKSDAATSADILWAAKRETDNKIVDFEQQHDYTFLRMHSPASEEVNGSVEWYRSLVLVHQKYLVLYDYFKAVGSHDYEILFHFDRTDVSVSREKILTLHNKEAMHCIPADLTLVNNLQISEGLIAVKGKTERAPMATYTIKADGDLHSFMLFTPQDEQEVMLQKFSSDKGAALQLKTKHQPAVHMLFANEKGVPFSAFGKQTDKPFEIIQ